MTTPDQTEGILPWLTTIEKMVKQKSYKPVLLLSIIAEIESGRIDENIIPLTESITEKYNSFYRDIGNNQALGKAHLPYYYLKSDIWDIHWKDKSVEKIPSSDSGARKLIEHVSLKQGLHEVLMRQATREMVKERLFYKVEEDVRVRDTKMNEAFKPPENIVRLLEKNFGKIETEKEKPEIETGEGKLSLEFAREEWLKELLVNRWSEIAEFRRRNLVIHGGREVGVEYDTRTAGRIDILAENEENGDFTVIELKRGISRAEHLGQVLKYMGWVRGRLSRGKEVNGLLIAAGFRKPVQYAITELEKVNLLEYDLQFQLKLKE